MKLNIASPILCRSPKEANLRHLLVPNIWVVEGQYKTMMLLQSLHKVLHIGINTWPPETSLSTSTKSVINVPFHSNLCASVHMLTLSYLILSASFGTSLV